MDTISSTPPNNYPGKGMGIAALVLGIIAICGSWIPIFNYLMFVPAVLAIIFGSVAMKKAGDAGATKGMAITGLVTGIISLVLIIIWTMAIGKAAKDASDDWDKTKSKIDKQMDSIDNELKKLGN